MSHLFVSIFAPPPPSHVEGAASRVWCRFWRVFWLADTEGTRFSLAIAALLWAGFLLAPGDTMVRPTYSIMRSFMSEEVWASAFALHGVGALLMMLASRYNKVLDLIVNVYGSVLWVGSSLAMALGVWPLPAAISGEIVLSAASLWVVLRVITDRGRGVFYDY